MLFYTKKIKKIYKKIQKGIDTGIYLWYYLSINLMKGENKMTFKALLISLIILISIILVVMVIIGLIGINADCAAASRKSSLGFLNVFTGA